MAPGERPRFFRPRTIIKRMLSSCPSLPVVLRLRVSVGRAGGRHTEHTFHTLAQINDLGSGEPRERKSASRLRDLGLNVRDKSPRSSTVAFVEEEIHTTYVCI